MKGNLRYKVADEKDIENIVKVLRCDDEAELIAITGGLPEDAIKQSISADIKSYAVYDGEKILAIFGIGLDSPLELIAAPWAVFSEDIKHHKISLIKLSRNWMDYLLDGLFNQLENWVDARNLKAIAYIKAIGFTVSENPQPYGKEKRPFHFFYRKAKNV